MNAKVALVVYGMLGGGIETYLMNLGLYFKNKGIDVTIITTEVQGAWFDRLQECGVKYLHVSGLEKKMPYEHVLKVCEVLEENRYDVIMSNHARYVQATVEMLNENTIFIPILHGDEDVFFDISSYHSELCNCIVTVSPKLANSLSLKKPECPIRVIPNGVKIPNISQFQQRTFYEKQLRLIYVGRLRHEEKGVLFIPALLSKIKDMGIDVVLDVVGNGNDYDELVKKFKEENVFESVKMWGELDSEKVYELLCRSHFLLFPSFNKEGLPFVPIEAQMCGCIPIASRLSGSTDVIIKDQETGILVDIGDVGAMCQAILNLGNDRNRAVGMSQEAMSYSREYFSVQAMGNKYYSLIQDAVNGKYPFKGKREGLFLIANLTNQQLFEKYFDIIFVSGTNEVKDMYRFWMNQLVVNNNPISSVLYDSNFRQAVIFGALRNALYLFKDLSMAGIKVTGFIDNNLELENTDLCGLPIYPSSWLVQHMKEVDVVVISIESASDVAVKEQLIKLTNDSIEILTWKELVRLNGFSS